VERFVSYIKKVIQRAVNLAGYDIERLGYDSKAARLMLKGIKRFEVDLILDVGANAGQFALELRSLGYEGRLVSFEPLSSAHTKLEKAARQDSRWTVHPRCAIGAQDGEAEINIAGNSVSSSILPMMESHVSASAGSAYIGAEKTPVLRLDTVAPPYLGKAHKPFLKIDAQGYEWQVLDGAGLILPRMSGVLCELSLVPLYDGQRLWLEIIRRLEDEGFTLWSIHRGFTDPRDGRTLQADALFFRL
jgi:FkbM family methyltransferase